MANVAVGGLDILTDVIVHALAHLCGVVDLVLEDLEYVCVNVNLRVLSQVARA